MKTKCRLVLLGTILLIGAAMLFLPYREYDVNANGQLIGDHTKWRLLQTGYSGTNKDGALEINIHTYDFPVRYDILAIEILCLLFGSSTICIIIRRKERRKKGQQNPGK